MSKRKKPEWWKILCLLVLAINIVIGILHFFKMDFYYDTDIARDFLLLQDMVDSHKISLIGGRSSIPGVFHGPLYYWLILPFFILSKGNPLSITIFWQLSYWLFLVFFYLVSKKMSNGRKALTATAIISSLTAFIPFGFTHTVLANFLIMPLIYFVYSYAKDSKAWQLAVAVFLSGLTIQFQMAFGVPMLILLGTYSIFHIIKTHNYHHLFIGLLILLPLSTFIMFDLRHDFIQIKSVLTFLTAKDSGSDWKIINYLIARVSSILDSFNVLNLPVEWFRNIASIGVIVSMVFLFYKNKKLNKTINVVPLCLLVIFGFWIVTIPFKDTVWPQYYKTLLPVIVFVVTLLLSTYVPKKVGNIILFLIITGNSFFNIKNGIIYLMSQSITDEIHWKFYRQMVNDIVINSNGEKFGYYVFSPDQYGYQGKYAIKYFTKSKQVSSSPYKKESLTYLVVAPNMSNNPWANDDYWQKSQVKINRNSDYNWTYSEPGKPSYTVKRFDLTDSEIAISSDPLLLDGIYFR